MGEARRRLAAGLAAAAALEAVPAAVRAEIAREVQAVEIDRPGATGGERFRRATLTAAVLARRLGVHVPVVAGGMVYRHGPDPHDVIAFSGDDGRAASRLRPLGVPGHWWCEASGFVVDFTPPEWAALTDTRFVMPPPPYVWTRRGEGVVLMPELGGLPPAGAAFYLPAPGMPPRMRKMIARQVADFAARLGAT